MMMMFLFFMKNTVGPVDPTAIPIYKDSEQVSEKEEGTSAVDSEQA